VAAIGAGRKAARSIHLFLNGEDVSVPENAITPDSDLPKVEELVSITHSDRVKMPELSVDERAMSFTEVELGLSEQMAAEESARCLKCGLICYRKEG